MVVAVEHWVEVAAEAAAAATVAHPFTASTIQRPH